MEVLRSCVVRIHRQDVAAVDGMVESVDTGEAMPFHTARDLWVVLCRPAPPGRQRNNPLKEREP